MTTTHEQIEWLKDELFMVGKLSAVKEGSHTCWYISALEIIPTIISRLESAEEMAEALRFYAAKESYEYQDHEEPLTLYCPIGHDLGYKAQQALKKWE